MNLENLIQSLNTGDYETILKGTKYEDYFACGMYDETHPDAVKWEKSFNYLSTDKILNAALTVVQAELIRVLVEVLDSFNKSIKESTCADDGLIWEAAKNSERVVALADQLKAQ